jgi:hypothetical protein
MELGVVWSAIMIVTIEIATDSALSETQVLLNLMCGHFYERFHVDQKGNIPKRIQLM